MFGTLKPQRCRLPLVERQAHDRLYCGLCQSLGEGYGTAVRGLLSHDAVFLALLAEGLQSAPAAHDSCRCPLVPIVHRPTLSPASPAMRYAAAYQLLLADQFLADRQADGRRFFGAARALLSSRVARARTGLVALGIDPTPLEGFESRQLACERRARVDALDAARPTAEALALVLAHAADLPGADPRAAEPATRAELGTLGFALGEIIYLQDALEDLRKDALAGAFNPCLAPALVGRAVPDRRLVERACSALTSALERATRSLRALPLRRYRSVLESVLEGELGRRSREAMRSARAWTSEAGLAHLAHRADPNPLNGLRERWLFALAFLTSWFAMIASALAQGKAGAGPRPLPRPSRLGGAGRGGSGRGGHGGSAGTAGQAGQAGQAGSAGQAGQAGDAGSAGQAGEAGYAGSAGQAGDAGSAGSGGASDAGQGVGGIDSSWLDPAGQAGSPSGAGGAGGASGAASHGPGGVFDPCPCLPYRGGGPSPGASSSTSPPALPVPSGGGFDAPAPPGPAPGGGSGSGGCDPCSGCNKTCNGCVDACTEPCKSCGGGKGCDGSACCNSCSAPCQSCCSGGGNCCDGCNGCGNCCNSCNGCGNCCNGCNGCGNGCNGCNGCSNGLPDPSNLSDGCDKGPWA